MYIPPGFNTVTPYYFVDGAEAFIAFLVDGLGGEETGRTMRPDGGSDNAWSTRLAKTDRVATSRPSRR